MKDAYSFDTDWEGLDRSYWDMYQAYHRIFGRCGMNFRAVEADAGAIGGEGGTHEFMALADIGEDTIATCTCCEYAANLEKAESLSAVIGTVSGTATEDDLGQPEKFHTPDIKTIAQLEASLGVKAAEIMKTVIFVVDGEPVAVVIRGDQEINELKVKNFLSAEMIEIADPEAVQAWTGVQVGFVGPYGLNLPVLMDHSAAGMEQGIAGANESEYHYRHLIPSRDISHAKVGDFRTVQEGDPCPRCADGTLKFYRGIEVGHVFKLGTKYSEKLGATYLDATGKTQTMIMGCYGIGISRILSAVIEQNHDDNGIVWPLALAPYHVHLVPISVKDEAQMQLAGKLYNHLQDQGVEVLLDDRDERAGVKFKDADLIGLPVRIVIGKGAGDGMVEYKERRTPGDKVTIRADEAVGQILNLLGLK